MNGERRLQPLSEIEPEPIPWIWEDRVAGKALNALLGNPSEGKSAIANDLIARVTTGRPGHRGRAMIGCGGGRCYLEDHSGQEDAHA